MDDEDGPGRVAGRATISRALALLDLFTADAPLWSVEAMSSALGASVPTCYRYVRELVEVGLLMRLTGGSYGLGPRIVMLDYTMRQADPLLRAALPFMRELTRRTVCDCVISALYGDQILDIHREVGSEPLRLAYGRGRPRPPFQGAAPKVILAAQTTRWQRGFYAGRVQEAAQAGMGESWVAFRGKLVEIGKRGHYVSRGELESQLCAVAVAIPALGTERPGFALTLVTEAERFELLNQVLLTQLLSDSARRIGELMLPPG